MKHQSGFTLVEILVVIVIISILSAIAVPAVIARIDEARVESAKAELRTIELALKMYRMDNFNYPPSELGLRALIEEPTSLDLRKWNPEGYLDEQEVPVDPWGTEYQYLSPGPDGSKYVVYSFGADGQPGGEDFDADISTADL